ncbi:hypothetical protein Barb7_03199 [Bacteroidales bacterium Barb7]|nr:hypothetical protein Barb7_03199 [Bacteroidales bacterium Barb7]
MNKFQRFRILHKQIDTRNPRIIYLLIELFPVGAAFMIHPSGREEADFIPCLADADAKINILPETHLGKAPKFLKHTSPYAHIEAAGIEFIQLLFSPPDASRCKERSHGVIDGFLNVCETVGSLVGTAKCIGTGRLYFFAEEFDVIGRQDTVGIQYNQILTAGFRRSVVSCQSGTSVGNVIIGYRQFIRIGFYNVLTLYIRAVLYDNNLKVSRRLSGQTVEKFLYFAGTVIYGDDEGEIHGLLPKIVRQK